MTFITDQFAYPSFLKMVKALAFTPVANDVQVSISQLIFGLVGRHIVCYDCDLSGRSSKQHFLQPAAPSITTQIKAFGASKAAMAQSEQFTGKQVHGLYVAHLQRKGPLLAPFLPFIF
jgi:hypothetical protein